MAMELLAAPHLTAADGGFYSTADAARARTEHLEGIVLFWPYMAVVDAFQHWVYEHAGAAADPAQCDAQWARLWQRFMPGIDYSGMEDILATGWHRKLHIFQVPFYYIEYGLAQLGAVQIWRNAIKDKTTALAGYRAAIALGGSVPLPQLFAAAGARFAFDAPALQDSVALLEQTLADLEAQN
jgi:oligoendopeptidase F